MKYSNLAQRLEEFEATLETLRRNGAPLTRHEIPRPVRRAGRVRGIRIRDQGLRSFRVC